MRLSSVPVALALKSCNQGCGSGSGLDPDSVTLWIRIRIGNPDPGSGSRGKKVKKFHWKNALFSYLKKILPLKRYRYKIARTTFWKIIWRIRWITTVFFIWFDSNFDFKKIGEKIVVESSVLAWIRIRNWIRIEQKCWIRIRIESIRIPGVYIIVRKWYLFPPPLWTSYFFPTRDIAREVKFDS
jgi:hypothetical protein